MKGLSRLFTLLSKAILFYLEKSCIYATYNAILDVPQAEYISTVGIVSYILTYVSKVTEVAMRSAHDSLTLSPLDSYSTVGIVLTLFPKLCRNSTRIHGSFYVPSKIRQIH